MLARPHVQVVTSSHRVLRGHEILEIIDVPRFSNDRKDLVQATAGRQQGLAGPKCSNSDPWILQSGFVIFVVLDLVSSAS